MTTYKKSASGYNLDAMEIEQVRFVFENNSDRVISVTKELLCHHSSVFREMFGQPDKDQLDFLRAKLSPFKIEVVRRDHNGCSIYIPGFHRMLNPRNIEVLLEFMHDPRDISDYAGEDLRVFHLASRLEVSAYIDTVIESLRRHHTVFNSGFDIHKIWNLYRFRERTLGEEKLWAYCVENIRTMLSRVDADKDWVKQWMQLCKTRPEILLELESMETQHELDPGSFKPATASSNRDQPIKANKKTKTAAEKHKARGTNGKQKMVLEQLEELEHSMTGKLAALRMMITSEKGSDHEEGWKPRKLGSSQTKTGKQEPKGSKKPTQKKDAAQKKTSKQKAKDSKGPMQKKGKAKKGKAKPASVVPNSSEEQNAKQTSTVQRNNSL